jgi:hypothetical protein
LNSKRVRAAHPTDTAAALQHQPKHRSALGHVTDPSDRRVNATTNRKRTQKQTRSLLALSPHRRPRAECSEGQNTAPYL